MEYLKQQAEKIERRTHNFIIISLTAIITFCITLFFNQPEYYDLTVKEGVRRDANKVFITMNGEEIVMRKDGLYHILWMDGIIEVKPVSDYVYYNIETVQDTIQ
jgi:hypothetical protein